MFSISLSGKTVNHVAAWIYRWEVLWMAPVALLILASVPAALPLFLLITLLWIARRITLGRWSVPTPLDGAVVALLVMAVVGYGISIDRAASWTRLGQILWGVAMVYALVNGLQSLRRCRLVGDALLFGTLAVAILALLGADWRKVRLLELGIYDTLAALPTVDRLALNPRPIAMGIAALLPVALSVAMGSSLRWRRWFAAGVALVAGVMILLLQSLQAMLGVSLALLVLLLWQRRWFLLIGSLALAAIGGVLIATQADTAATALLSLGHPIGAGVILRWDMWNRALAMIRDMPWTGVGLDGFEPLQAQLYHGVLLGREPHAHQLFLQLALDLGLPGLVAFLWLLITLFLTMRRTARAISDSDLLALLQGTATGVVAYVGAGLIDSPWSTRSGLVFWVLVGVAIASARQSTPAAYTTRHHSLRPWALWGMVVGVSLLLLPGMALRNRGTLQASRLLTARKQETPVSSSDLWRTIEALEEVKHVGLASGDIYRMLGWLYAETGHYERAVAALAEGVRVDGAAPLATYAPWEDWRHRLLGTSAKRQERWEVLARVYGYWWRRYPTKAVAYVQAAVVWNDYLGDPVRATAILREGLAADAEPSGLLLSHRLSAVMAEPDR